MSTISIFWEFGHPIIGDPAVKTRSGAAGARMHQ